MIDPIFLLSCSCDVHCRIITIFLPEEEWSCKRLTDILALYKHKSYQNLVKMTEQSFTLITHNPLFIHLVHRKNQIPGHRMQLFLRYPSLSHFPILK